MNPNPENQNALNVPAHAEQNTDTNLRNSYSEKSRRLTCILEWLQAELDGHYRLAMSPENAGKLQPYNRELEILEINIKTALWYISGIKPKQIDEHLAEEGIVDE